MGNAVGRILLHAVLATAAFGFAALGVAEAQPATARVALLSSSVAGMSREAIREIVGQRLAELGWVEGRNLVLIDRHAESLDQQREISAELEREKVDVVVACSPCSFSIAPFGPAPIRGIPIVFAGVSDPVAVNMVSALNRPGGNMTGISYMGLELNAKRLQLLKEALPHVVRVGVLVTKDHSLRDRMVAEISRAAVVLKLDLQFHEIPARSGYSIARQNAEIDQAFATMAAQRAQAVIGLQGPHFARERVRLAELGMKYRLPGSFETVDHAQAGNFMAYGLTGREVYRAAADYANKILRGARPADLPVEQPTKLELVINLKTAKALGLTIPPSVLFRATQVIE
jgi:putative ABC transport system substrate-binding protein